MSNSLQNLVLFKLGWLACVMLAASGQPALAMLSVAAVVSIHLFRTAAPGKEAVFLLTAVLVGFAWESLMVATGVMRYPATPDAWLAPVWIVSMWALFATTINHGFHWLKRHWLLGAAMGLIGGPLAFLGGVKLGAAEFGSTFLSLTVIGLGWAALLPLLSLIADTIIDSSLFETESREPGRSRKTGLVAQVARTGTDA